MAEQLIVKNLPFIKVLPAWAQELSYKYCSKTANLYLLSGNIRDFLPHKMKEGEFNFVKIQDYVSEVLFGNRDIIVHDDVPVAEEDLGHVVLDLDEVELPLLHLVGEKIADIAG